jgi:hypothetical protein
MTTRTMDKAIGEELLRLETEYWQAIVNRDVDTALRATDDPCIVAGASGVATIDHKTFRTMMEGSNWNLKSFKIDKDIQVRQITDDVAILAYKVHEELTVDGKPVAMDAADTSVWRRSGSKWINAMHTEALLGDAYGRDRKK